MTTARSGWSSPKEADFASRKDHILVRRFRGGTFADCDAALQQLLRDHLPKHPPAMVGELRRRIAETALQAASGEPWPVFAKCLARLREEGFTNNSIRLAACALAIPYVSHGSEARAAVSELLDESAEWLKSRPDDSMSAEDVDRALGRLANLRSREQR